MWVTIRHHVTHPSVARVFSFASKSYFFNIITQCLFEGNLKYGYSTPMHVMAERRRNSAIEAKSQALQTQTLHNFNPYD